MTSPGEPLRCTARLFARLLLSELDRELYAALCAPEVREGLRDVSITLPAAASDREFEWLAARYFETFIQPDAGGPLVQSLWEGGAYEGECAVRIAKLAAHAGLEFDRSAARGAPRDHLGCILLLWAAADEHVSEVAARLVDEHLTWALPVLERLAQGGQEDFYAGLARAVSALIRELEVFEKRRRQLS